VETDELKPKARGFAPRTARKHYALDRAEDSLPPPELAEIVLDESGYTDMWQKDKSADAAGRLENLKGTCAPMEEFEILPASSNTFRW